MPAEAPRRLAIVGAGISGLAAAHAAVRAGSGAGKGLEVVVIEGAAEVGGRSRTIRNGGWLLEAGPSGYLDNVPEMSRLVRDAGLDQERVEARPAAARRFIFQGGRLHEVGANLLRPALSGLLGPRAILRILGEPLARSRRDDAEESIHDFARRRFGDQFARRVVDTAMLGIFAGDARRLSLDACFPELRAFEREHGSVVGGMLRRRRRRHRSPTESPGPSRKLCSFRGGLQRLPSALAETPGIELRLGAPVADIESRVRPGGGTNRFRLALQSGESLRADAVVLATPARVSARLLEGIAPAASADLAAIPVPPIVVVGVGFAPAVAARLPHGFGVLVARGEGFRILGCLLESHIYPGRGPDDHMLIRVMLGGALDPEAIELNDEQATRLALSDLRGILGIDAQPAFRQVVRWPQAIPQYEIGHLDRRRRVAGELRDRPGLYLAGDALDGVSFAQTAANGVRQGRRAAAMLKDAPD